MFVVVLGGVGSVGFRCGGRGVFWFFFCLGSGVWFVLCVDYCWC